MHPSSRPAAQIHRSRRWASAALLSAAAACSAPAGGPTPQLTYTQASAASSDTNNVPVIGTGDPAPFSSRPLAALNIDWTAYAMNNSSAHGTHLYTGLNAEICLDVNYGLPANATPIHIYTCNPLTSAQSWTLVDSQVQIADANGSPFCLSLQGGSLNANVPITVACTPVNATTDSTQLWRWEGGLLRLADSNQCLSLTEESPQLNEMLKTFPCDANNHTQQWRIANLGVGEGNVPVNIGARINSRLDSNTCMDLQSGDTNLGIVESYACNTSAAQKWVFEAGTIYTTNNACVTADGQATAGAKIKVTACTPGEAAQQWVWAGSTLMLAGSELCICVPDGVAPSTSPQLTLAACPSGPSSGLNCQWLVGLP